MQLLLTPRRRTITATTKLLIGPLSIARGQKEKLKYFKDFLETP